MIAGLIAPELLEESIKPGISEPNAAGETGCIGNNSHIAKQLETNVGCVAAAEIKLVIVQQRANDP